MIYHWFSTAAPVGRYYWGTHIRLFGALNSDQDHIKKGVPFSSASGILVYAMITFQRIHLNYIGSAKRDHNSKIDSKSFAQEKSNTYNTLEKR